MMTFSVDAGAIVGAATLIAGALIYLAREVSGLSAQIHALGKSVDVEREDRLRADSQLEDRILRLEDR